MNRPLVPPLALISMSAIVDPHPAVQTARRLVENVARVWRGARPAVELVVAAWLARGHVLVEDLPGVGKTTLARALAASLGGVCRRLQGTPDLLPGDVTGIALYDQQASRFVFRPGPVFADVLLADELNRMPPRTQAALLEALAEGQVTVDGETRPLPARFVCLATQNPHDQAGTYPLPDSQRDRFLICTSLGLPNAEAELDLLRTDGAEPELAQLRPVAKADELDRLRASAAAVTVEESVQRYLLALIHASRTSKALAVGASPRAAIGLQRAARARALIAGRAFVLPDDLQALAVPCLAHRVTARANHDPATAIRALVETVPVPR